MPAQLEIASHPLYQNQFPNMTETIITHARQLRLSSHHLVLLQLQLYGERLYKDTKDPAQV
jgi:hypothetical protein